MFDPVRLAAIGLGGWAHALASAYVRSNQVRLVSCYSRSGASRGKFARAFGCECASSLTDLLSRPDIEAVVVTVPNDLHADVVEASALAGKHVFLEKPIAADMADARRIVEVVRRTGVRFACGHSARYLKGVRRLKSLLEAGALGEVSQLEASFANQRGLDLAAGNWRADPQSAPGGVLTQIGVHHIDNVQFLLGDAQWVFCAGRKAGTASFESVVELIMECNGRLAYIGVNWRSPGTFTTRVYGTKANACYELDQSVWARSAEADSHSALRLFRGEGTIERAERVAFEPGDYMREQVEVWAQSIRTGSAIEVTAEVATRNLAVVLAAVRSMSEGRAVRVGEVG